MERRLVLDVSRYDEGIDLAAWKMRFDAWGVIVKLGGNEAGMGRYRDPCAGSHYEGAVGAGLHVGAYYYTTSTTVAEAERDAGHFCDLMDGLDLDLPAYVDIEDPHQLALTPRELTDVIHAFCGVVRSRGHVAGVYTGGAAWMGNVIRDELYQYADWIAAWGPSWPDYCGDIGMWQQGGMSLTTGAVAYDDVGGYVDFGWCVVDYPSRKGEKVEGESGLDARIAKFCERMRWWCEDANLGYDQWNREDFRVGGECDCSSLVTHCLREAGFDIGDASYTGNMSDELCARGWKRLPFDFLVLQPGDILLNDACHTCAVISGYGRDAIIAQASIDENGRISGGQAGDQTGYETNTRQVYMYSRGWDCILRYGGNGTTSNGNGTSSNVNGTLSIDGYLGRKSVAEWQRQMGTTVDGVVSGQWPQLANHYRRLTSVDYGDDGSWLISEVQRKLGVDADGILGPVTIKAIQRFVGVEDDGYLGPNTARAIQRSLNDGKWE